jgi:hypothetical protein
VPAGSHFAAALVELMDQSGHAVAKHPLNFLDLAPADAANILDLRFGSDAGR